MPGPVPAGTGGCGAPGAGQGLVGKTPSPILAVAIPVPAARAGDTWGQVENGKKKEERKGRAARECVGGAGSIPSVTCQPKPRGPLLGTPWGCNRPSLVAPGCKPHFGTRTAPAHTHRCSRHVASEASSHAAPLRVPLCPRLSLSRTGTGQTPKGRAEGSSHPHFFAAALLKRCAL